MCSGIWLWWPFSFSKSSMLVRALYAFSATSGNELTIHADERLALIEGGYSENGTCFGDAGWVRVVTLDGVREGFVPASYVMLDKDDDVDRQHRLLKAHREAEHAREVAAGEAAREAAQEAAREAAAAKVRTAKRAAIRRNATAAKAEAKAEAAAEAAAAASAAEAAKAGRESRQRQRAGEQATVLCGGAAGPAVASQAAEAPDDYDSSSACSHGPVTTVPRYPAAAAASVLAPELTNRELKALCARHGIDTSSALERADLIELAQPCLPTLPTPAGGGTPAAAPPAVAAASFTPRPVAPSRAAAQPCDGGQLPMDARPVFQKDSPQEAHLRKARIHVEAYFQTQPTAEEQLRTSADSGAEGPSKRRKVVANPLPERTAKAVRLPHPPPSPTLPIPLKRRSLMLRQANLAGGDLSSMSVGELKRRLIALGISLDGMIEKSDLVARLTACHVAAGISATLPPAETASSPPLPPVPACSGPGPPLPPLPACSGLAHTSTVPAIPSPWVAPPPPPLAMTAAEAEALAEAEGLSLVLAPGNHSGYKGVSRNNKGGENSISPKSGYCAQFCQGGRTCRLGSFSSAPEAALAYARHLNAVIAWKDQVASMPLRRPCALPLPAAATPPTPAPVQGKEQQQEWQQQANMHAYTWLHAWRAHHQETSAPAPAGAPPPPQTSAHPVYPAYVPMPFL